MALATLVPAAVVFGGGYLLLASPHQHADEGAPPVQGLVGMALSVLTLAVLSGLVVRRRRAGCAGGAGRGAGHRSERLIR